MELCRLFSVDLRKNGIRASICHFGRNYDIQLKTSALILDMKVVRGDNSDVITQNQQDAILFH